MKRFKTISGNSLCGVLWVEKKFELYGEEVSGVFPNFEGLKISLDGTVESLYKELGNSASRFYRGTMKYATKKLKQLLLDNPKLKEQFTCQQLQDIDKEKRTITGLVWHHYEELDGEKPIMQLVDAEKHKKCSHIGGSYTWNRDHLL